MKRNWFVYKYQPFNYAFNGALEPRIEVRAVTKDRTKVLDTLPSGVIKMVEVQAKNKAEAYQLGVQKGGF